MYQCPMKCEGEKTYESEGKCPKCGMFLQKIDEKVIPIHSESQNEHEHTHNHSLNHKGHEKHNLHDVHKGHVHAVKQIVTVHVNERVIVHLKK